MIEQTLSHYRVIEKLGAGRMGKVYLAKDTKLDRTVGVKIKGRPHEVSEIVDVGIAGVADPPNLVEFSHGTR